MQADARLFGETALSRGFITREQLASALERQKGDQPLGTVLVEMGLITAPQANAIDKLKAVLKRHGERPDAPAGEPGDGEGDHEIVGKTLGGCLILEPLGTGAMGTAYRAHHMRLDRDVVVKVLHPRLTLIPGNLERFAREARAAAGLEHPAIVQIYDFDSDGDFHFIVMQHVDGQNLRQVLSTRGALGQRRGLWVAARVLEGLAHAHARKIVHRDIKPANLLITREPRIKIADFGLVRILSLSTSEKISVFGEIIGTPQYMAPEQATCDDIDGRTDLYSLGITLWELIAGRPPFSGTTTVEVLEKQIMAPLPDLRELVADVTPELIEVLARLTAKDPAQRYQTADEALHALQELRAPERSTTRIFTRSSDAGADPSRDVAAPAIVTEEALDELKKRLRASKQFVAFETELLEGGDPSASKHPDEEKKERAAAVDASLSSVQVSSSELRRARRRLADAAAAGSSDRVIPELLRELLEGGHVDDVLAIEREVEQTLPTSAAVAFFLGMARERKEDLEAARAKLALATVLSPDHLPARLHLARVQVALGLKDDAVRTLEEANRWHPTSVQAATRLAEVLYVVKGDAEAALPAYERAIELAPNRWQLRQQLALLLEGLGRYSEAIAVLEEVVAWRKDKDASSARALLMQIKKKQKARKKKALASASEDAPPSDTETGKDGGPGPSTNARLDAIRLASAGGRWERAVKVARDGLKEKPRSVPLLLALANAQFNLGKLSDAVTNYGLAISIDPGNQDAIDGLMRTQEARKKARDEKKGDERKADEKRSDETKGPPSSAPG